MFPGTAVHESCTWVAVVSEPLTVLEVITAKAMSAAVAILLPIPGLSKLQ